MIYALATLQTRQDLPFFILPIWWNHDHDRFSDRFRSRITVKALRTPIPARDPPVEILADDGVIRGIDDGSEHQPGLFRSAAFCNVARNAKLDDQAVRTMQRYGMRFHAAARAL